MHRAIGFRFRSLKDQCQNDLSGRFLSSGSAVLKSATSGGILGWLGVGSSKLPSLDIPLQGVDLPPCLPDSLEPGKTFVTKLSNGFKIASENSPRPTVSIGLYVACGPIYESPGAFGVSHLLEKMAFKTTRNRSHLRVIREVEAIGGNVQASVTREQIAYTFDAVKSHVPEMVELLIDTVRNPVFLDWEVDEQIKKLKGEIGEKCNDPIDFLMEAVHFTGFSGALAKPLVAPESSLDRLNSSVLEEFEHFTAPRMVLAASGVDHEELISLAEPLISDLPGQTKISHPNSLYTGGDYRFQTNSANSKTNFALAFEFPGGWLKEKDAMILAVLQVLLGGGGSFSTGGPGKGMYSRLYLRILNEHPQIQSFSAFNNVYNDTSIFGIVATTESSFVSKAIDLAARELMEVGRPGAIDEVELARAKQLTKSAILMNLESRMNSSEDIGRQVLIYEKRYPVEHFLKAIEEVTLQDITKAMQALLSSPLTMASNGNVIGVPSYDSVTAKFKSS